MRFIALFYGVLPSPFEILALWYMGVSPHLRPEVIGLG